jgi:hypothetical protein
MTLSVWARMSPSTTSPSGVRGIWPETKTRPKALMAWA